MTSIFPTTKKSLLGNFEQVETTYQNDKNLTTFFSESNICLHFLLDRNLINVV